MDVFIERLNKINSYFSKISDLVSKDILNLDDKLTIFNDKYNNILFPITLDTKEPTQADIKFKYPFYYNYELKTEKDYMSKYFMYRLLLKINKLKFNDTFLYKLIYLVNKIYKKKVEFNIVNLKKMHLNSDIYTQAVSLKLRNKDNRLYRILKASLRKIKLPTIRKISEKQIKPNKNEFIINKIRNNIISFMFKDDNVKDPLSNLLLGFYPLANNIKVKNLSVITGGSDREENKGINNVRSIYLTSYVRK
jgi:hypothetical protein